MNSVHSAFSNRTMDGLANSVRAALGIADGAEVGEEEEDVQLPEGDDVESGGDGLFSVLGRFKEAMGIEEEKPPPTTCEYVMNCGCIPALSWEVRLWGFGIFFSFGMLISFLSTFSVATILVRPGKFAFLYTLGNVLSIFSLAFLTGPCNQLKRMCDSERRIATSVYLLSMGLTLLAVIKRISGLLILPLIFFQFCALVYYSATYIPYGRQMLNGCISTTCGCVRGVVCPC